MDAPRGREDVKGELVVVKRPLEESRRNGKVGELCKDGVRKGDRETSFLERTVRRVWKLWPLNPAFASTSIESSCILSGSLYLLLAVNVDLSCVLYAESASL